MWGSANHGSLLFVAFLTMGAFLCVLLHPIIVCLSSKCMGVHERMISFCDFTKLHRP